MPHRRRVQKGSFSSHFDELVAIFPVQAVPPPTGDCPVHRDRDLQERIDVHGSLFEKAWRVEGEN